MRGGWSALSEGHEANGARAADKSVGNDVNAGGAGIAGNADRDGGVGEVRPGRYGFRASERRRGSFARPGDSLSSADCRRCDRDDPPAVRLDVYETGPSGKTLVKSP